VAEIIKTWPACVSARSTARMFSPAVPTFHRYYFTLGRGRPKLEVSRLWFTYLGRILGYFEVEEIVVNDGTLPQGRRLDGGESEWQMKKDAKVAICAPPCVRLKERLYMEGFRGWRYFNLEEYRGSPDAKFRL
jgi:hypothetical protein